MVLTEKWRFMEFKLNATSPSILQIEDNREKASLQLARTLTSFKEKMPDGTFNSKNCICIIVSPVFYPKISAIDISKKEEFRLQFGVSLQETTPTDIVKLGT